MGTMPFGDYEHDYASSLLCLSSSFDIIVLFFEKFHVLLKKAFNQRLKVS